MPEIVVCMKIIIDPEAPASIFNIDSEKKIPLPPTGMPPVFSPFDLNALEAALKIKDQQECTVTVLCMGKSLPKALLQKALAMGADKAVALEDAAFENLDPFSTAATLVKAIRKIGRIDMVFTGRQAADWDAGLVWAGIAEGLNLPCVTIAREVIINGETAKIERCAADGIETLEADLPVLVTFSSEVGEPRFASLKAMMTAAKKPIERWKAPDVDFKPETIIHWDALSDAAFPTTDCEFVDGDDDEDKGRRLARLLKERGLVAVTSGGES